jgi:DNA-directed RNA polymerase II subunit RPB2
MNLEKDTWNVIANYFDSVPNYITKHHLDSYNDFVNNKIYDIFNNKQFNPQVVVLLDKENTDITYLINVYYGGRNKDQIEISRPVIYNALKEEVKPMYPNEARLKNLTYAFNIFCDIEIEYIIKEKDTVIFHDFSSNKFSKINIGRVPIMLHSNLCSLTGMSRELLKKAGECPYDHGGYFIIDGREKVCVSRERKSENILYINKSGNPDFTWSAEVKSVPAEFRYARNTYLHVILQNGEIVVENPYFKSGKSETGSKYIPLFVLFRVLGVETDKEILEMIFYNLDKTNEFAIQGLRLLNPSINSEDNRMIYDQMTALKYLEKFIKNMDQGEGGDIQRNRVERFALLYKNIYDNLFPHVGNDFREKALYLGYCVNQLLQVILGIKEETDRDSFEYKRIDLSGFMIANLFRDGFSQLLYDARNKISSAFEFGYIDYKGKSIVNIISDGSVKTIFSPTSTEEIVLKGFRTGTLTNPGGSSSKKGVIQQIDRRGFYSYLGQIRRIVTPNDTGTRVAIEQRQLHASQYGYFCPMTIMDGTNVGVKKHLTCLAQITAGCPSEPLLKAINDIGLIPLTDLHPRMFYNQTKVFLNGKWVGVHEEPASLVEWIKLLRRNGLINIFTSISWKIKDNIISILSDGGRCTRPLYIVNDNQIMITEKNIQELKEKKIQWMDLVVGTKEKTKIKGEKIPYVHNNYYHPHTVGYSKTDTIEELKKHSGVIEFLDNNDMNNVLISATIKLDSKFVDYTHVELHEVMMLSLEAQGIPFVDHNQFPRNVYGIGQSKQAAAVYATNFMHRIDQTSLLLSHPQKPLNNTRLGKYIFNDRLGHGQNIIVAVAAYNGYNQEDSVICCQDSIDLGMLKIDYFKGYEQNEKQDPKTGTFEYFYNPEVLNQNEDADNIQPQERKDYSKLDQFGFIKEGTLCNKGNEIVAGKYIKLTRGDEPPRDISIEIKGKGEMISKVFTCYTDDTKNKLVKIRTVKERVPIIGDKIGSRFGQKGVLGITLRREDMPHTKSGIRPDIIINPGAFPKRQTNGHLIETFYSKLAALLGLVGDGTAFIPKNMQDIISKLEEQGFEGTGNEILYSGIDGQQMSSEIYIGPCFYQRFKQMVNDKIHSRASGARTEDDLSQMGGGYTARERQPLAGRALGGGGRIGEMERDAIVAHGISGFLKESMMERSDKYYTHFCQTSGRIAVVNEAENLFISPDVDGPMNYDLIETLDLEGGNENTAKELQQILGPNTFKQKETEFFRAYMPYCAKLLIQECEAIGLSIRLRSDGSKPRLEENRFTSEEIEEMSDTRITNRREQLDDEYKELESLKDFLRDRYSKENDKEGDDKEGDDKEGDDASEAEEEGDGEDKEKSDSDIEGFGKDILSDEEEDKEEKDELVNPSPPEPIVQTGGADRDETINYYREESTHHENLPSLYDSMNTSLFETGEVTNNQMGGGQRGGALGTLPNGSFDSASSPNVNMSATQDMGNRLTGGTLDNFKIDPIAKAYAGFDRPFSPDMNSGAAASTPSPVSDIKIINLDPNYRLADDSAPSMDNMSGGGNNNYMPTQTQQPSQQPFQQPQQPQQQPHPFQRLPQQTEKAFDNEIFIQ